MSAQPHFVPDQNEGRMKAFLEWKNIGVSYMLG